ncbi:hypothetical protein [Dyadobacter psychrotolerans]|uniref:DUF2213 domain-containing protein n=1 Tax=Dyadobacter psychrotolerans TaxID=2541721 RepID=A0A4R5DT62_9BACT|nr:hypothetical protein [Dyadobacter psychrotolerans]TDE17706.1 hypothetical protein E0F88_07395 [Dyadobacter psychrotolerans]
MTELSNASQHAKTYYCRHMTPGVVGYRGMNVYIPLDTIKAMAPSFDGKPVYIDHRDIELENIQDEADGYVTQTFFLPEDGWLWSKVLMISDKGIREMDSGKSISNSHRPIEWGDAGKYLNIPYQKSVKSSVFTHLGIVDDPRYEDAKVFTPEQFKNYKKTLADQSNELHNSKNHGVKRMLNLFKMKREAVETVDTDTMVELQNAAGETVAMSIGDMVKAVEEKTAADIAAEEAAKVVTEQELTNTKEVEVDGVRMPVTDLVAKYKELQNAKDEADKKATDEAAQKALADAAAQKVADEAAAKAAAEGQKHFDALNNANEKDNVDTIIIQTSSDKAAIGQSRYGSSTQE